MDLREENFANVATLIPTLRAMFSDSDLTESTLKVVVNENQGDLDKCVDTILDLITDPLEVARKAQMEEAQREIERARQEQQERLRELERQIQEQEEASTSSSSSAAAANNNNNNNSNNKDAEEEEEDSILDRVQRAAEEAADALEARMEQLTQKANSKNKHSKKNNKKRQKNAKARLQAEKQLHRDFEERAAEEAAQLKELQQKLDAQLEAKLKAEIANLRQVHNKEFQAKVESEVARRLVEVDRRVAERKEAEKAERERAKALAEEALPAANKPVVELELDAKHAMPGDKIAVKYRYKKGEPSKKDWMGFFKGTRPADSNQYYTQQYTDGEKTGMLSFVVPNKLGVCEFRFFQNADYQLVSRSAPLHVGPRATVEARIEGNTIVVRRKQVSGTPSTWDWVGLYLTSEQDGRNFVKSTYTYLTADTDSTVIIAAPKTPGRYEVRFFSGGSGYSPLATSNLLVVDDNNTVSVEPHSISAGGELRVTADIKSLAEHSRHWLAVFLVGEVDNHQYVESYSYVPKWNVPVTIAAPNVAGTYEVRVFERGSYKLVKASQAFEVKE